MEGPICLKILRFGVITCHAVNINGR